MGGDKPVDSPSTRVRRPRELNKNVADANNAPSSKRKRGRPVAGKGESQIKNDAEDVGKDSTVDTAIILKGKKLSGLRSTRSGLNHDEERMKLEVDNKQQTNDSSIHEKEFPGWQKTHRRKRGRPQKVLISSLNAAVTDQIANVAKDEVVVKDSSICDVDFLVASDAMVTRSIAGKTPAKVSFLHSSDCKKLTDYPSNQKTVSANTFNTTSPKVAGSNGEGSNSQHKMGLTKKAIRRISSAKENSQTQDTTMVKVVEPACITKEAKMDFKLGSNMSDDQPLSKWFEELQFTGPSAVAKLHTESTIVKELIKQTPDNSNGTVIASDEVDKQDPAVGTQSLSTLRKPELPFVKNTSLWVVVESMEVFRMMPQKPHFRPLLKLKESSREGFALACMVNFSSAVENISRLQLDDPKGVIDDILDTLNDLETHGFSVQVLRDLIRELMSIKEDHEQLRAEVDDINKKVALYDSVKSEQDKEIHEITIEMKKLQERVAKAESIKEMKDGEIASLESRKKDVEEAIRRGRSCYEELGGSL